jgi:hypothetical protein
MAWNDGKVTRVTISSKTGGTTTVCYNGIEKKVKVKKGKRVTITL